MITALEVVAALAAAVFTLVSLCVRQPKAARLLGVIETVAVAVGVVGIITSYIAFRVRIASPELTSEYIGWAYDSFAYYFRLSLVVTAVFALTTLIAAVTDHKMMFCRCALAAVGAVAVVLIAAVVGSMSVSDKVAVQNYVYAVGAFEALLMNARGAVDDFRLAKELENEKNERKKRRKKK